MMRRFLSVVPRAVKSWAWVTVACAVLIGAAVVFHAAADPGSGVGTLLAYAGAALLAGVVVAVWLLCLGFIFGDARRRAMPPWLWVLVAALFPHLLGFLLYFVMRQPIGRSCAQCGRTVALEQRFCSWCGSPQGYASSGEVRSSAELF